MNVLTLRVKKNLYKNMEIKYQSKKLEKSVSSPKDILKNYGTRAKLVKQRIEELKASPNLEVMRTIPKAGCHELTKNRDGELAVDISANHRIIFIPDHSPIPLKPDGGLDWLHVTKIKIVSIGEDYH